MVGFSIAHTTGLMGVATIEFHGNVLYVVCYDMLTMNTLKYYFYNLYSDTISGYACLFAIPHCEPYDPPLLS